MNTSNWALACEALGAVSRLTVASRTDAGRDVAYSTRGPCVCGCGIWQVRAGGKFACFDCGRKYESGAPKTQQSTLRLCWSRDWPLRQRLA